MMNNSFKYFDDRSKTIVEWAKRAIFEFEDYIFEKKHGLDLSGMVPQEDLVAENKSSISHATAYHAVWCRNLRVLFAEARKTGSRFENFVDIGSGKGKACFYAHTTRSFKSVVGLEFSKPLVEIAEKNRRRLNADNVSFVNADASDYTLPGIKSLVFMFNPFDAFVLEKFISNNLNNFAEHKSVIAYANDIHRLSLTKFGFETIYRDQTRAIALFRHSGNEV